MVDESSNNENNVIEAQFVFSSTVIYNVHLKLSLLV